MDTTTESKPKATRARSKKTDTKAKPEANTEDTAKQPEANTDIVSQDPAPTPSPEQSESAPPAEAPTFDLEHMSRDELVELQKSVEHTLRNFEKRRREDALAEMQAVAQKHGLDMKAVLGGKSSKVPQAPKFRHPENPELTWTGKGRQPRWYKEAVEAGTDPETLRI